MSTLAERIVRARKAARLTQQQLANEFAISRVSVTNWESGKTAPERDKIPRLAALLKTSVEWLLDGDGGGVFELEHVPFDENSGNAYRGGWKPSLPGGLPQLDARAGADDRPIGSVVNIETAGIASGHLVTQEWVVPRAVLGSAPSKVFALPVDGTSMEPGLNTGDIVFVEPADSVVAGEMYVVDDGDGPMVKRLRIDRNEEPPRVWISSDNPAVPDFWRPLDAVRIIGQVIGKFVRLRSR